MRQIRARFRLVLGAFVVVLSLLTGVGVSGVAGLGADTATASATHEKHKKHHNKHHKKKHKKRKKKAARKKPGPYCGAAQTMRASGRTWTCSFDDEFAGSTVDRSKWLVTTTESSRFRTADSCYVDDRANVNVSRGALHLVAITGPLRLCAGLTRHTAGSVVSYDRFAQTHGRFEARLKYPATTQSGLWSNFWISPDKQVYGPWPASGEVDIAEHWTSHGDYVFPSLHYPLSTRADTGQTCVVKNAATWHTYRLDWSTTSMSFYYDGRLCFRRDWTIFTRGTRPFDQPFDLVLTNGFGDPTTRRISSLLPKSASMDVDYVRVWR